MLRSSRGARRSRSIAARSGSEGVARDTLLGMTPKQEKLAILYGVDPAVWAAVVRSSGRPTLREILRAAALSPKVLSFAEDYHEPEHVSDALGMAIEVWVDTRVALERIVWALDVFIRSRPGDEGMAAMALMDPDLWCWFAAALINKVLSSASLPIRTEIRSAAIAVVKQLRNGQWPKKQPPEMKGFDKIGEATVFRYEQNATDATRLDLELSSALDNAWTIPLMTSSDSPAEAKVSISNVFVSSYAEAMAIDDQKPHASRWWEEYDETVDIYERESRKIMVKALRSYDFDRLVEAVNAL